jgi:histidyl-tRNA synthetase
MKENDSVRRIVEPSVLSGFMELLPKDQVAFNSMLDKIRYTFESYGFIPLDTPVLEKSEVLLAKSGGDTAKQVYRFTKGDTDMAMRFDLTVPLARYVAQHYGELAFPFRRYHIGKVYRGERPQKGRFREFYQCDIDIIGNGSLSINNDAEIVSIIYSVFKKLDIGNFTIMINNRKLLNGFFDSVGVTDKTEVLRIVDKLDKIGRDGVREELGKIGVSPEGIEAILRFTDISGSPMEILQSLEALEIDNEQFLQGKEELAQACRYIAAYKVSPENFAVNLKIARGLDYYTGTVYETVLDDYPSLGSICSGGRYDELASNYTKQSLPGVGISIGLSRLFYQLREAGILKTGSKASTTELLIIPMADTVEYAMETAAALREAGINTEVYLNEGKMGKKFSYADKLGIRFVSVIGEDERNSGMLRVKNMVSGEQQDMSLETLIGFLKAGK